MSTQACTRCDGCGQIANDEDGTPWSAWEALPPESALAVRLGFVKPVPCPECDGHGVVPSDATADQAARALDSALIERAVGHISDMLNESYGSDVDIEVRLWRRVTKVGEEAGEVQVALRGLVGENPRKGRTHSVDDLVEELLDCAGAALGAVHHLRGGPVLPLLRDRVAFAEARLSKAMYG